MLGLGNIVIKDNDASFNLASVAGLQVWYDFNTASGAIDDWPNGNISNSNSYYNSNYDLTVTDGNYRPVATAAASSTMGKVSLRFDGSDDHLVSDNEFVSADACVLSMAIRLTGDLTDSSPDGAISGDTAGLNRFHIYNQNTLQLRFNGTSSGNNAFTINLNNTDNGTVAYQMVNTDIEVIVLRKDASNNIYVYNKNGDFVGYLAADANTDKGFGFLTMGGQLGGSPINNAFAGFIGEFAIHNGDPGEATCKQMAKHLYEKWRAS